MKDNVSKKENSKKRYKRLTERKKLGGLEINKTKISATSTTYSHGQHVYGNFSKRMKGVKYLSYLEKSSWRLSLTKVNQQTLKTGVPRQENRVRRKILKGKNNRGLA